MLCMLYKFHYSNRYFYHIISIVKAQDIDGSHTEVSSIWYRLDHLNKNLECIMSN